MIDIHVEKDRVFDYVERIKNEKGKTRYVLLKDVEYYSKRYNKWVIGRSGEVFDGATGALDINSFAWLFHDILCRDGKFGDGSPCNNWQASKVISDILKADGRWLRCHSWFWATWLFGGGQARRNGMI